MQISGTRGQEANTSVLGQVQDVLKTNNLPTKSIVLENGSILARFTNTDDQLLAKDKIAERLGNNYTTALNLAPATPAWLSMFGANPMKWGLDLRGGVRFFDGSRYECRTCKTPRAITRQFAWRTSQRKKFNIRQLKY